VALLSLRTHGQIEPPAAPDAVGGQTAPAALVPVPPPQTRLEKFARQGGIIVVKGYTVIGELAGSDGSNLRVTAVQFSDAMNPSTRQRGVVVQVREPRGNETISYVDADELDGLISAVTALGDLRPTDTPLQEFEGRYSTRGELEIANVNVGGGRIIGVRSIQYFPHAGQVAFATGQFPASRTSELAQLLTNAKQALDKLPEPGR
jgi:hypothetical protein